MSKRSKSNPFTLDASAVEDEILCLACSMIRARRVDGKPDRIPAGWVEKSLIRYGRLGWISSDTDAEGFYRVHRIGVQDRYGVPCMALLTTDATASPQFAAEVVGASRFDGVREDTQHPLKVAIVKANALSRPPIHTIRRYAQAIAACDVAIPANIIASMRSQIIGVPDTLVDSAEDMLSRGARGLPVICAADMLDAIKTADVSVDFRAVDYNNLRETLWGEAIKQFGGITPAQYKAERTQTAEVSAHIAASIDNVYQMIDQFNEDAEKYDVPYRLEYVGVGAKYEDVREETYDENDA